MSTTLNEDLASVFTNYDTHNMAEVELYEELQPLENIHLNVNEVQEQLANQNICKASELDDLHPRILN